MFDRLMHTAYGLQLTMYIPVLYLIFYVDPVQTPISVDNSYINTYICFVTHLAIMSDTIWTLSTLIGVWTGSLHIKSDNSQ